MAPVRHPVCVLGQYKQNNSDSKNKKGRKKFIYKTENAYV